MVLRARAAAAAAAQLLRDPELLVCAGGGRGGDGRALRPVRGGGRLHRRGARGAARRHRGEARDLRLAALARPAQHSDPRRRRAQYNLGEVVRRVDSFAVAVGAAGRAVAAAAAGVAVTAAATAAAAAVPPPPPHRAAALSALAPSPPPPPKPPPPPPVDPPDPSPPPIEGPRPPPSIPPTPRPPPSPPSMPFPPGGTLEGDYSALVALYESAGGAHWTANSNWLSGSFETVCMMGWQGVHCGYDAVPPKCDAGDACGICLDVLDSRFCPPEADWPTYANCADAEVGTLCDGDGGAAPTISSTTAAPTTCTERPSGRRCRRASPGFGCPRTG